MSAENWRTPNEDDLVRVRAMMADADFHDRIDNVSDDKLSTAIAGENDTIFWVYHADGCARAYVLMQQTGSNTPKIDEFAVLDRGMGYGKAALAALIAKCAQIPGYEKIWLNVVTDNEAAIGLYRRLGFGDEQFIPAGWVNPKGVTVDLCRMFLYLSRMRTAAQ